MACKKCKNITPENCEPCDFEIPASCIVDLEVPECFDAEDNLQSILDALCEFFADGVTGTFTNPTSITVVNGVITSVS